MPSFGKHNAHENITIFSKTVARQSFCFYFYFFKYKNEKTPWQIHQLRLTCKQDNVERVQTYAQTNCNCSDVPPPHRFLGAQSFSGEFQTSRAWRPTTWIQLPGLLRPTELQNSNNQTKIYFGLEMERGGENCGKQAWHNLKNCSLFTQHVHVSKSTKLMKVLGLSLLNGFASTFKMCI